ncbi:MAG: pyrroline-5-carboxylate reductase [Elusimicrobia bacterium RIFCSPLOWO2_01_FULL_54_10]|nr:MAG: pyrroline-5-carboxylate reductase [Elusimicrobia bacterium RIFCSPLOWO2_01_FULL_54_10]
MGTALMLGAVKAKILKPAQITAFDVNEDALKTVKKKAGVKIAGNVQVVVPSADYIFICVKPQQMNGLLTDLKGSVSDTQCLITIAAGVKTGKIEAAFSPQRIPVVRVMPNTPALLGEGASAVCGGKYAKPAHIKFAVKFFSAVGKAVVLPESAFDAVTAVSGSGPAYVFYLAEALASAARAEGLPDAEARILVDQTLLGAAKMLAEGKPPEELRQNVTSPGGTTEAALKHLEAAGWKRIFEQAVRKARERSDELSKI